MYVRHGDENTPRIVVQPVGWSGFIYSDDAAEKWIRKAYPELKQYQIERAVNYLASTGAQSLPRAAPETEARKLDEQVLSHETTRNTPARNGTPRP